MYFDLAAMLTPLEGLDDLVVPFRKEEIDSIIAELKTDKSHESDGLNSDFIKKC
jgi:hypothetical protein